MFRQPWSTIYYSLVLLLLIATTSKCAAKEQTCVQGEDGTCSNDQESTAALIQPANGLVEIDWGETQLINGELWQQSLQNIEATKLYMAAVRTNDKLKNVVTECKSRDKLCSFWAAKGECQVNPNYMKLQCAPACQTCDQLDFETRCPFDKNAPLVWQPGDLNRMFERITTDPGYQKYTPQILSQPPKGPWVVVLDNVVSAEECQRLIELGGEAGYERSKDKGKKNFAGNYEGYTNNKRTSTNAWCVKECYDDEINKNVLVTMENITGIPEANGEHLQLLKYQEGQFYKSHHDYIAHHIDRAEHVRILTVFLYLNDVQEGGGTHFNTLKLTVQPKQGRVVIWPSVLDDDPTKIDKRTDHEALPVKKGVKYGANAWMHQRDFKVPYSRSCQ